MCAAGNGTIEFHEFLTVMSRVLEDENTEDDMITVFRILDQDGDGFITKSALRECCIRSVGQSDLRECCIRSVSY